MKKKKRELFPFMFTWTEYLELNTKQSSAKLLKDSEGQMPDSFCSVISLIITIYHQETAEFHVIETDAE